MITVLITLGVLVFAGLPLLIFFSACVLAARADRIEEARHIDHEYSYQESTLGQGGWTKKPIETS